jgi:hypothetical protein
MTRVRLAGGARRALKRLSEPSSAAGLAALLALIAPDLAEEAPAIVDLALVALAAGAGLRAIVRGEGNGSNGQ